MLRALIKAQTSPLKFLKVPNILWSYKSFINSSLPTFTMADSTPIYSSVLNLGEIVRAIEKESGQPAQLVVKVGGDEYLVGDLRKRKGEYRLEMQEEYASSQPGD